MAVLAVRAPHALQGHMLVLGLGSQLVLASLALLGMALHLVLARVPSAALGRTQLEAAPAPPALPGPTLWLLGPPPPPPAPRALPGRPRRRQGPARVSVVRPIRTPRPALVSAGRMRGFMIWGQVSWLIIHLTQPTLMQTVHQHLWVCLLTQGKHRQHRQLGPGRYQAVHAAIQLFSHRLVLLLETSQMGRHSNCLHFSGQHLILLFVFGST